jgi:hypothetical protein
MAPAACVVAAAAASSLLLAAALAAASSGSSGHAVQYVLANTTWGAVRGQVANGTQVWKGVRYAAPASGALRWAAPQPPAPWTGVADALDFAPGCLQNSHNRDTPAEESEDCLFVNVWSPLEAPGPQGWPVMVFIHGGGYFEVSAASCRWGPGCVASWRWPESPSSTGRWLPAAVRRLVSVQLVEHCGCDAQLPLGRVWFSRDGHADGQLRPGGPASSAAMGSRQRGGVWRRAGPGHCVW